MAAASPIASHSSGTGENGSVQGQERQENWEEFGRVIQDYSDGLFCGQERLFLALICYDAGLCVRHTWGGSWLPLQVVPFEVQPSAVDLHAFLMEFLGCFMTDPDEFDHFRFLQDAGVVNSCESEGSDCTGGDPAIRDAPVEWDSDEEDTITDKYLGLTFSAAAQSAVGLLHLLERCRVYPAGQLHPTLDAAKLGVHQLPACAMLNGYLPGPLNLLKRVVVSPPDASSSRADADLEQFIKFRALVPLFQFRQEVHKLVGLHLKVTEARRRHLYVVQVHPDGRFVEFSSHASSEEATAYPFPQMRIKVEFDPEVARLLLPDMCLTGSFDRLSDGSWCFHSPGPVQPPLIASNEAAAEYLQSDSSSLASLDFEEDSQDEAEEEEEGWEEEDDEEEDCFTDCDSIVHSEEAANDGTSAARAHAQAALLAAVLDGGGEPSGAAAADAVRSRGSAVDVSLRNSASRSGAAEDESAHDQNAEGLHGHDRDDDESRELHNSLVSATLRQWELEAEARRSLRPQW